MNQLLPLGPQKDKFTPELRILAASLLSMVVIILWAKYFGPKPPVNVPQDKAVQSGPAVAGSSNTPAQQAAATNSPVTPAATMSAAAPANLNVISDSQERTTIVENAV